MYAVIKTGGKQYRVEEGQTLKIEKLEAEVGATYSFEEVLMVANGDKVQVGAPLVKGCQVKASVVSHGRHEKVFIIKFRRRKHHQKTQGHRQYFTEVKIDQISV